MKSGKYKILGFPRALLSPSPPLRPQRISQLRVLYFLCLSSYSFALALLLPYRLSAKFALSSGFYFFTLSLEFLIRNIEVASEVELWPVSNFKSLVSLTIPSWLFLSLLASIIEIPIITVDKRTARVEITSRYM